MFPAARSLPGRDCARGRGSGRYRRSFCRSWTHVSGVAEIPREERAWRPRWDLSPCSRPSLCSSRSDFCRGGTVVSLRFSGLHPGSGTLSRSRVAVARLCRRRLKCSSSWRLLRVSSSPGITRTSAGFWPGLNRVFNVAEQNGGANMSRIAIIGAGAWGTGLAIVLGRGGGHQVQLWAHEKEVRESISSSARQRTISSRTIHSGDASPPPAACKRLCTKLKLWSASCHRSIAGLCFSRCGPI